MTRSTDVQITTQRVAAKLRERGHAARAYRTPRGRHGQPESGVLIHVVCTEAWRYPDGHWDIFDRPARLLHAAGHGPHTWMWNDQLVVPEMSSTSALVAWVAEHLPPPEHPEYRTYWHFSSPGERPADPPEQWEKRWREHLFAELHPSTPIRTTPARDTHPRAHRPARINPHRQRRSIHTTPPGGNHQ